MQQRWQSFTKVMHTFFSGQSGYFQSSKDDRQLRLRMLRRLLPTIVPVMLVVLAIHLLLRRWDAMHTYIVTLSALATVLLVYSLSRTGRYNVTVTVAFALGSALIIFNATATAPPHLEISYLLLLPLVASVVLSLPVMLIWSLVTLVLLVGFARIYILPIAPDTFADLTQQALIFNAFFMFIGFQRKVIEQERQHLALAQERYELIQNLLSSISHDFKTPLSIIKARLYVLQQTSIDAKQRERMTTIELQVNKLDRMVQHILTLARLDHVTTANHPQQDLRGILETTIEQMQPLIAAKAIAVHTDYCLEATCLHADPDDLARITTNLLENAVRYTPTGGNVTVRLFPQGAMLNLEVEDNGIGIAAEALAHIFEPFYRGHNARGQADGDGLGLALVKKTIENYGGVIAVTSTLGAGTCFHVSLPRC